MPWDSVDFVQVLSSSLDLILKPSFMRLLYLLPPVSSISMPVLSLYVSLNTELYFQPSAPGVRKSWIKKSSIHYVQHSWKKKTYELVD